MGKVTFSEILQGLYGKSIKLELMDGSSVEGMIDFVGADVIALMGSGVIPFSAIVSVHAEEGAVRNILTQRPYASTN